MQADAKKSKRRTIIDFEKIGLPELVVLGKYNYNKAERRLEDHVHTDMIEICYYDKGSQWFEVNKKRYLVRGGDVFLHYPGEVHGSGGYPEARGCLYWFIIKSGKMQGRGQDRNNTHYLVRELMEMQRRHFRGGAAIKKMLEDIFGAVKARGETPRIKQIKVTLLTQSLLLRLIEYAKETPYNTDNERLQKVYDLIDAQMTENMTITALAKEAHLSESRFKNWFKELSGFTPVDYVQRKRVEYAVRKIKEDPSVRLKDLAYDLNFSSQQYFATVIKKFTGKSPKEMR